MALGWTCMHCGDSGISHETAKVHRTKRVVCYPCTYVLFKDGVYDDDRAFLANLSELFTDCPHWAHRRPLALPQWAGQASANHSRL